MFKSASKIESIITKMQGVDEVAATVVPIHGKKKKHKIFWSEYNKLIEAVVEHFKFLETYSGPDYKLPFNSDSFAEAWKEWQIFFLEEKGRHLGKIRGKKQVMELATYYDNEDDAKKALNFFINRGYTFVFKINKDTKNGTKTENKQGGADETDWDNYKE